MEPQLWATNPCTAHEVPVALSPSVMIVWVRRPLRLQQRLQLCPLRPQIHAAMMSLPGTTVSSVEFPLLPSQSQSCCFWHLMHSLGCTTDTFQYVVRPVCSSGQQLVSPSAGGMECIQQIVAGLVGRSLQRIVLFVAQAFSICHLCQQ